MKLARESHLRLETFFREYFNEPELKLPPVYLHSGLMARLVTRWLRVGAVTFGRHILLSPREVTEADGLLRTKGWLIAHEATHVLQYEREGHLRFLFRYFYGYWRAMRAGGKWSKEASMSAYLAIEAERVAHQVQHAYQDWKGDAQT